MVGGGCGGPSSEFRCVERPERATSRWPVFRSSPDLAGVCSRKLRFADAFSMAAPCTDWGPVPFGPR